MVHQKDDVDPMVDWSCRRLCGRMTIFCRQDDVDPFINNILTFDNIIHMTLLIVWLCNVPLGIRGSMSLLTFECMMTLLAVLMCNDLLKIKYAIPLLKVVDDCPFSFGRWWLSWRFKDAMSLLVVEDVMSLCAFECIMDLLGFENSRDLLELNMMSLSVFEYAMNLLAIIHCPSRHLKM